MYVFELMLYFVIIIKYKKYKNKILTFINKSKVLCKILHETRRVNWVYIRNTQTFYGTTHFGNLILTTHDNQDLFFVRCSSISCSRNKIKIHIKER